MKGSIRILPQDSRPAIFWGGPKLHGYDPFHFDKEVAPKKGGND